MTCDLTPLDYARLGLQVFPCHYPVPSAERGALQCSCGNPKCASPGKHPYYRHAPQGHNSASTDEAKIKRWLHGPYNVAIRTGAASGIFAIDVDPRHDGDLTLAEIEREHGALPPTWRFISGSGGPHILFRHPGFYVACDNEGATVGVGIDVKGDGGYIVAPPSRHVCGRRYEIDIDHHPDDVALADAPDWLLQRIRRGGDGKATMPEAWRTLVAEGVSEGARNNAITRISGHLLRRYVDPLVVLDLVLAWSAARCRPPLDEAEVTKIVDSIAARELVRRERANG